jgi:hypothetical protein
MQIQDIILDSITAFVRGIGDFLPNILAAIVHRERHGSRCGRPDLRVGLRLRRNVVQR